VHNRTKRLPPVAAAFKDFLLREGAPLIEQLVRFEFRGAPPRTQRPAPGVAPPAAAKPPAAPAPARRRGAKR
jgi:hypothetical protein